MCGIAGMYSPRRAMELESWLLAMAGELAHRGPDGVGLLVDGDFGMVNTRLSIFDLQGGDQPLADERGRFWVMQNGEIYNFPEVRERLEHHGHHFSTSCDTEVIAHAFEHWGSACLHELNGDFALAIWDSHTREIFLARDRFGVRPLFVAQFGAELAFASEIKALLRHPAAERALDPSGLAETFTLWSELPDRTVFQGIRQLAPGHSLRFGPKGLIEERRWWDINFTVPSSSDAAHEEDLAAELRSLLEDSVTLRLRADVSVGTYLSGGLDSSIITALTRRVAPHGHPAFGVGFEDARYDESGAQVRAAQRLGTTLHQVMGSVKYIGERFPEVIALAERPLFRTAPAPLHMLSRCVRDTGIKVALTGEGADELFGGYDIFKESKVRRLWARQPDSSQRPRLLQRLYPYLNLDNGHQGAFQKKFFARGLGDTSDPLYSHRLRFASSARNLRFMRADALEEAFKNGKPEERLLDYLPDTFGAMSSLGKAQYLEITTFLSGYLLHAQGDRMMMGNSVEGRFPFLDHRLAEFAAGLPDRLKLHGLNEKYLLRKAVEDLLPERAQRRAKQPYRAPITQAFVAADAPEYVSDILSADSLQKAGIFDVPKAERLFDKCRTTEAGRVSESDEMAYVGMLSTMLLHDRFIAHPHEAPSAMPSKVVRLGVTHERYGSTAGAVIAS